MPDSSPLRIRFVRQLQLAARNEPHRELAARLGISTAQLRNWIYRDTPKEVVARALMPKLNRK